MNNDTAPFCIGCPYATDTGTSTYCPFVEGSCVKVMGTIRHPNPRAVQRARLNHAFNQHKKMVKMMEDEDNGRSKTQSHD